jgi:hypothetical protein
LLRIAQQCVAPLPLVVRSKPNFQFGPRDHENFRSLFAPLKADTATRFVIMVWQGQGPLPEQAPFREILQERKNIPITGLGLDGTRRIFEERRSQLATRSFKERARFPIELGIH